MRPLMRIRPVMLLALLALLLTALATSVHALAASQRGRTANAATLLFAQHACTPVYASTSDSSTLLTQLLGGTDVTALGASGAWEHVRIWSGIEGYTPKDGLADAPPDTADEGSCIYPGVPDAPTVPLDAEPGPWKLDARGALIAATTLSAQPGQQRAAGDPLAVGAHVTVSAWASDDQGRPWYQITSGAATGWVWSGVVQLDTPDPLTRQVHGEPIWQPVAGKGMWFTNYFTRHTDVDALVRAAKLAGLTHLYAEVAITKYGFYGKNSLDRLLPAAHAAGVSVIAWVYPTLDDIATDTRMTLDVAHYVTPTGQRADGIATDVEEADDSASVYTYGQLLRAALGPDTLLVDAAYHPFAQPGYPYAAVAASWNVLAPMNYWHSLRIAHYSADNVRRFVTYSLTTIRASLTLGAQAGQPNARAAMPIEELGQTYDMYSDDGAGTGAAPTGDEITADLQTAHDLGCIGASYFEWQSATQANWSALASYNW